MQPFLFIAPMRGQHSRLLSHISLVGYKHKLEHRVCAEKLTKLTRTRSQQLKNISEGQAEANLLIKIYLALYRTLGREWRQFIIQRIVVLVRTLNSIHFAIRFSTCATRDSLQSGQVTTAIRSDMIISIPGLDIAIIVARHGMESANITILTIRFE